MTETHAVLAVAVPFLLAALALLKCGWWPRRQGETPYCRRCGYNLTGSSVERCPECGRELASGRIVRGERHRRPLPIALGIICLLPPTALLIAEFRGIDWYAHAPARWLIGRLSSADKREVDRAWLELSRRRNAGVLSDAAKAQLLDACLSSQMRDIRAIADLKMVDYLGKAVLREELNAEQCQRFVTQTAQWQLSIRPRVAAGQSIPFAIGTTRRIPDNLRVQFTPQGTDLLDGKPFVLVPREPGYANRTGCRLPAIPPQPPGLHTVEVQVNSRILVSAAPGATLYQDTHTLKASFEVLPEGVSDVAMRKDATIEAEVREVLRPRKVRVYAERRGVMWEFPGSHNPKHLHAKAPANLAMDVFVRIAGQEYLLHDGLIRAKGEIPLGCAGGCAGLPADKLDIIFRASAARARETRGLFEIWDGEVVFTDVPTTREYD